ncbi:hypothetical protein L1987_06573 [Smallanthus sonchifolius]|uniref:Uncharacterized protein n=1 Tax=Smallanthus sonchifolius TaxID=185202 RepID=A0ACB9JYL0_9ASTR|nr:hypothetical protein L1987_06573 [Smallanthus sonchifolius]
MGNHETINKDYDYIMQNLSDVGKKFYKESPAGATPKIAEKAENTTKGKSVHEVSDDDFVTPRIKKFKRNTFVGYLSRVSHPRAYQIKQAKISRMEMPWQTLENNIDCGVYMMRHIETFKGTAAKDCQYGLTNESEKQQHELNDLRRKYVTKMLLHDINISKEFIISKLKDYLKMDADVKRHLHGTARERMLQRLKNME